MNKLFLLFLFLLLPFYVFAEEEKQENYKYTILKTTHDYSPVREAADVNSKRATHLKKGTTLYSDEALDNFYRVDLGLDKYYWIEKKYADVDSTSNEKRLTKIEEIELVESDKYYAVKINSPILMPYNEIETSKNSLDFILYDVFVDRDNVIIKGKNDADFKISKDEFNNLKISYFSNYPLTGHEVVNIDEGLLLKVKKPFKSRLKKQLKHFVFVIDPGHGGREFGAVSFGLKEKDINFEISKILEQELKKEGAKVYLTRYDDTNPDLYDRIDFAKEKEADFLFSIHQNSLANPEDVDKKHGVGVYYYNKEAFELSKEIQNALKEATGFKDDGINLASFALTRAANPLCVLIECGYIIHPEEAKMLADKDFQHKIAKAVIKGVKNYLKNNFN